jgi:hypothetical protein
MQSDSVSKVRATYRVLKLGQALTEARIKKAWKTARIGLRNQPLVDLHDYLDTHRNLSDLVTRLQKDVSGGTFHARESEVVRLEKSIGVCRRLVLPSAIDAVVLQAIVDYVEPQLLAASKTKSAYYNRTHQPPSVAQVDDSFPYPWARQWPVFQKRILGFAVNFPFVVFTDIANYFDSMPLQRLRNKLSGLGRFDETVIDLLFYLIEAFVWRPEYIPFSGTGLPQIDFDAPRLLAHSYLYDIDNYITQELKTEFVRWMDDFDFGVHSKAEGKRCLGLLNDELGSLGLSINEGKSRVLTGKQALEYLWTNENRRLTLLNRLIDNSSTPALTGERVGAYAYSRFVTFFKRKQVGHWEKVLKRYVTLFARTRHAPFDRFTARLLESYPSVRMNVLRFLAVAGYSPSRFKIVRDFLLGGDCLDDFSRFAASKVIVDWKIPSGSRYRKSASDLGNVVCRGREVSGFAGGLWLVAKYSPQTSLVAYIQKTLPIWHKSGWASRQTAAVLPLLSEADQQAIGKVIRSSGLLDALAVLANLNHIGEQQTIDRQLWSYLVYAMSPYPFSKVVIARLVLSGKLDASEKARLRSTLNQVVTDGVHRKLLKL